MNDLQFQNSLLLAQFRKFYREIARLKQAVQIPEHRGEADAATLEESGQNSRGVWNELRSLLEGQALEAGRSGGAFAYEVYREAQYVMAALADEVFLHLNWDGRTSWPLLESALFQTHAAGEILFQRLELLLRQRDPVYVDLAAVYFMALSLGFQGKFRGEQDHERLELYRRQLFAMIFGQKPQSFESGRPLFPQSQMYTLAGGAPRQLPNPRIWLWLVAAVVVVWLGVSHYLWRGLSGDVNCMIRQVSNPTAQTEGDCSVEEAR